MSDNTDRRVGVVTLRLHPKDKAFLEEQTTRCGLDVSVATRQLMELAIAHMRAGNDWIDTLFVLKSALDAEQRSSEIDRQIENVRQP